MGGDVGMRYPPVLSKPDLDNWTRAGSLDGRLSATDRIVMRIILCYGASKALPEE
jgi:hypothetical protein